LLTANNRSDDGDFEAILLSTVGVIFLGTPHRGAHSAQLGVMLTQAAKLFGANWKEGILQTLKYESKEILNLDEQFAWVSPSKELVCFYETKEAQWMGLVCIRLLLSLTRNLTIIHRSSLKPRRQFIDMACETSPWTAITPK
jgi:hypothetical protein